MKKRLGFLHAHHTNIEHIETCFSPYEVELVHFVDPGLLLQKDINKVLSQNRVKDQLEWIATCEVDAIVVTCTEYITMIDESIFMIEVPIIKIDEPFFDHICRSEQPQLMLFTNPNTINGTIKRLNDYAYYHHKQVNCKPLIIEESFDLLLQGRGEEYEQKILEFLLNHTNKHVSVGQLSMVGAAKEYEKQTSQKVDNPLDALLSFIINQLDIPQKIKQH